VKVSCGTEPWVGDIVNVRFLPQDQRAKLSPPVSEREFSGKAGSTLLLREQRVFYVGLGERAQIDAHRLRTAAGTAVMALRKIGRLNLQFGLEEWPEFAGATVEGAVLADYRFEDFKTSRSEGITTLRILVSNEDAGTTKKAIERGRRIAEATNLCRAIGNLPGNVLYPEVLVRKARQLAKKYGLRCTVLDESALRKRGFGGILAVGAGSARSPRMIILEYKGGGKAEQPLAFVGKAVTFDSGGISIKAAANMEEMIFDKCGGMAVLGGMAAIASLKTKRNVVGVIPCAENLPSATAYRPGDIITTYDGTRVEVINTDAEGRVILADAIAHARQDLKATAIVDLATLTGACGIALGEHAAGLWANDDEWGRAVQSASVRAGERVWRMPLFTEYEDQIKSDVAGLKNTGGRLGGACTGAAFLKHFARDVPWAHLDIAYMSHRGKDQAHIARGASGFGVRTLVELAETWKR
jgi:leucyl aminopeptidase